jgi:hypothetical protein
MAGRVEAVADPADPVAMVAPPVGAEEAAGANRRAERALGARSR